MVRTSSAEVFVYGQEIERVDYANKGELGAELEEADGSCCVHAALLCDILILDCEDVPYPREETVRFKSDAAVQLLVRVLDVISSREPRAGEEENDKEAQK